MLQVSTECILLCMEYSTQCVQGDSLVELKPEHVCHVKDAKVEAMLSDCEHWEEESWVYCNIEQMFSLFCAHIDKLIAQNRRYSPSIGNFVFSLTHWDPS